jgi:hypothetical protein
MLPMWWAWRSCTLWWKVNQCKLPLLAHLAHHLLCIPATSAPWEHVFSIVSIAKDHARLAPQTANKLVFYTMPFQLLHSLTIVNGEEGSGNRVWSLNIVRRGWAEMKKIVPAHPFRSPSPSLSSRSLYPNKKIFILTSFEVFHCLIKTEAFSHYLFYVLQPGSTFFRFMGSRKICYSCFNVANNERFLMKHDRSRKQISGERAR